MKKALQKRWLEYSTVAPRALENDYIVIPCNDKKPFIKGWPETGKEEVEQWVVEYADANVGLVCGEVILIDLDIDEPVFLGIAQQQVAEILGPSSYVCLTSAPMEQISRIA